MASVTVRISPKGHQILTQLSASTRSTMPEILDEALESYRRQKFLEDAEAAYLTLSGDKKSWQAYRKELAALDATLSDGLDD